METRKRGKMRERPNVLYLNNESDISDLRDINEYIEKIKIRHQYILSRLRMENVKLKEILRKNGLKCDTEEVRRPVALHQKRDVWYVSFYVGGKQVQKSTGTKDYDKAVIFGEKLKNDMAELVTRDRVLKYRTFFRKAMRYADIITEWKDHILKIKDDKKGWLYNQWIYALDRSKRTRKEMSFTYEDLVSLALQTNGHCEVCGLPFDIDKNGPKRRPFQPSLDRIENDLGYSPGNCRFVCYAVNTALNSWGIDVLNEIATALLKNSPTAHKAVL